MKSWYDQIEEPIRPLVRLLRDNGFNTVSSCGHENWIQMEFYGVEEVERLYNLLFDNGYEDFTINLFWPSSCVGQFIEVRLDQTAK